MEGKEGRRKGGEGREVESMESCFVFLSNLSNVERIYFVYATVVSGGYISHNVDDEKCESQREVKNVSHKEKIIL